MILVNKAPSQCSSDEFIIHEGEIEFDIVTDLSGKGISSLVNGELSL